MDETEKGKTASEKAPRRKRTAWWVKILIAVAVVLVVVGIAIPAYNYHKLSTKTAQAKENIYEISLALSRYAIDSVDWKYPEYLVGGSAPSTGSKDSSDPLIREGYLASYPKNPFATMVNVREIQERYKDPLRPGGEGSKFGFRFGEDYKLMGNVLADIRFPGRYAEFGYPFYNLWPKGRRRPKEYIPGAFFYRSTPTLVSMASGTNALEHYRGEIIHAQWSGAPQIKYARSMEPEVLQKGPVNCLLGLYGAPNNPGRDALGTRQVMDGNYFDPNQATPYTDGIGVYPPPKNLDGVPDCIILVLGAPSDS